MTEGKITMWMTLFTVLMACAGCHQTAQQASQSLADRQAKPEVVVSQVSRAAPSLDDWSTTAVTERGFEKIQMLSNTHGWTASQRGDLYRTTDGGDSWQLVDNFNLPEETLVTDFCFTDSWGGVAIAKNSFEFDQVTKEGRYEDAGWIMQTTDGGRNWTRVYVSEGVQIRHLAIVNDGEAWAVGRRFGSASAPRESGFIIHSADDGKTWTDVSANLPKNTAGIDAIYTAGIPDIILVSDGQILRSHDKGKSWSRSGTVPPMGEQLSASRVGMTDDNLLWVLDGTGGVEGTQSFIAIRKRDGAWTSYLLGGVYLTDLVFLSDEVMVAAGSMVYEEGASEKRKGVILGSTDGARSWAPIYQSRESSCINSLFTDNGNHIFAVGENGLILRRDLASTKTLQVARE